VQKRAIFALIGGILVAGALGGLLFLRLYF
jgi:hypothetical protein